MKNYFFINPAAGQGKGIENLITEIETAAETLQMHCKIYVTKGTGDGETAAKRAAQELSGEEGRFFACGGDGTLNEVINGIFGFDNVVVGCIPIGTGNDMVRNFETDGDFLDIGQQLLAGERRIDLMEYSGVIGGKQQTRYCANMFNIGFDCNVVELAGRLKKKPLISGSLAYLLAVLGIFIKKEGISLHLIENGETLADGEVLLCAVANGKYCGGGLKTSPQAVIDDGVFDLNIIKNVPRRVFLRLFTRYVKGNYLGLPGLEKILTMRRCTELKLSPKSKKFFLCADGEISVAESVEFRIVPQCLRFAVPKKIPERQTE